MKFSKYVSDTNPRFEFCSWSWSDGITAKQEKIGLRITKQSVVFRDPSKKSRFHELSLRYAQNDKFQLSANISQIGQCKTTFGYTPERNMLKSVEMNYRDGAFSLRDYSFKENDVGTRFNIASWKKGCTESVISRDACFVLDHFQKRKLNRIEERIQVVTDTGCDVAYPTHQVVIMPKIGFIFMLDAADTEKNREVSTRFGMFDRTSKAVSMVSFDHGMGTATRDQEAEKQWHTILFQTLRA